MYYLSTRVLVGAFIICIVFCYCYIFDSLRPINNLSVIKGRVFMG